LALVALRVLVVQHGEKERSCGDPGLTARGREQARITAQRLARGGSPAAICTSPMRRAIETAAPIAAALDVVATTDVRLRERMNWECAPAQPIDEFLREWRRASADRSYEPRSGDSSHRAASRFVGALDALAESHSGSAIVVTHGGVTTDALRTLLGDATLRSLAPALIDDGIPNCAITTLETAESSWTVGSIADTGHLTEPRHRARPVR
jgi:probable phosphoglycerate mutase